MLEKQNMKSDVLMKAKWIEDNSKDLIVSVAFDVTFGVRWIIYGEKRNPNNLIFNRKKRVFNVVYDCIESEMIIELHASKYYKLMRKFDKKYGVNQLIKIYVEDNC